MTDVSVIAADPATEHGALRAVPGEGEAFSGPATTGPAPRGRS